MHARVSTLGNVLSLLGAFVATAMVMGLLAAGLMMPAVGATGSAARTGVEMFDSLPSEFATSPLSQQSRILDARGGLITTPYDENRIIVPLSKISKVMQQAQIAIEDARFYEHGGVDVRGVSRAFVSNIQGGDTQGASTLTQQYVKITLQENALRNNDKEAARAAVAKTYTRKLQELKYAITLEKQLTKDQILEGYLNLVYYGDQTYGVEAAAQHYFSTTAAKLTLPQAALLAGIVQQPSKTDPVNNPQAAQARRDIVLDRMRYVGMIDDKQLKAAKAIPVAKMLKVKPPRNTCARSTQPYFCAYVLAYLKDTDNHALDALGKTVPERVKNINQGGLTIQTTLDPKLQATTLKELTKRVPIRNSARIGGAATVIEPGTGKVLAMAQASLFGNAKKPGYTEVNWNVDQKYGGTSGFAFGSTAKMYALVTALQSGMPVNARIYAKGATTKQAATYQPDEYRDGCRSGSPWEVRNDEVIAAGRYPLRQAIAKSINTAFASLVIQLGGCKVHKTMTRMGLHMGSGEPINKYPSAITLGSDSVTPLTIASSFATLAAGGKYCPPNPILSITTNDKKRIPLPPTACKQVIDKEVAAGTTELLTEVIESGTGRGARLSGGRPAAGKTGTTDGHSESWFVGYTPQLASAVWVGTPYSQARMRNLTLGGQYYRDVFGGTIAAPIWKKVMDAASAGKPVRSFPRPGDKILDGELVSVPSVSGMSVSAATAKLKAAGFDAQVVGSVEHQMRKGAVVFTDPGSRAPEGSLIGLYVSKGAPPPSDSGSGDSGSGDSGSGDSGSGGSGSDGPPAKDEKKPKND
jgi:membrane peptidoglycan carboxypeptidase